MTGPQKQNRPGANLGDGRSNARPQAHDKFTRPPLAAPRIPDDWRARLPAPADYYGQRVAKLTKPNAQGWAQGRCPLHEDKAASLSVDLTPGSRGGWRCFAGCGKGDLVSFHQRITGTGFIDAVRTLIGGGR